MKTQQLLYIAGTYMRLSKDDEGICESSSISTQRDILNEYAQKHEIIVKREYVDDGYSGTNYDRPGFKRMIHDIECGYINCVLTKDLSRLGRNSAKTSELLDEYFPKMNVRYIAVIEGYDNLNLTNGNAIAAPFMLLMNEMYARDISSKIRTSFQAKMEKGEYIGSFAPYGYKKDIEHGNKNHLLIDYQVAPIVQKIFSMAENGDTPKQISQWLNDNNVATPAIYRCQTRPYLNIDNYTKRKEWTSSMICKMLRNKVYLGCTQQGKTSKVSFKSKDIITRDEKEWITVMHTHEPIISQETYDNVRRRSVARRNLPTKGFTNVFSGIAKCADCGKNMTTAPTRKKNSTYNLACGGYKSYGAKECSNHFIEYDLLYDVVLKEIRSLICLTDEEKRNMILQVQKAERNISDNSRVENEIKKIRERMTKIIALSKKLYEDFYAEQISEIIYNNLSQEYESEYIVLKKELNALSTYTEADLSKEKNFETFFALLENIVDVSELTPNLLKKLIDKIEIGQGYYSKKSDGKSVKHQNIKIYYKFVGEIKTS